MSDGVKRSVNVPLESQSCQRLSKLNWYDDRLKQRIGVLLDLDINLDCIAEETHMKKGTRHVRKSKSFDFVKLTNKSGSAV